MMRVLARETLEQADFDVIEAADGAAALEAFSGAAPDLVLLDVETPRIDGFEVCRRIRRIADAAQVPVIMVTGMDDLDSINQAYEFGAPDFIAKPINWPVLGHRARYVLRGALAARALRAAEERNRAMLRAIPDVMFTVSADGVCHGYRAGHCRIPFLSAGDLRGRHVCDLLPKALVREVLAQNDTLGHNAGDQLLKSVAERLKDRLRDSDTVSRAAGGEATPDFARLGGDEFTLILADIKDVADIARVAERIQDLMSQPYVIQGQEIVVSPSIGVAVLH